MDSYLGEKSKVVPKLEQIGKYTIDRKRRLGGGRFGTVYLGTDENGKVVAGKEIMLHDLDDDDPDPDWIARVHGEIETHRRIPSHVNIVKYIDSVQEDNIMWVFTEPCKGGDLCKYLRNNNISERQKFVIMRELAEAIKHLHTQNPAISHRDVKAENILMGDDGHIKLCDLGLAKITEKKDDRTETLSTHCGTKEYMAPELFRLYEDNKAKYTKKVDIFSLGIFCVTLVEISPGQRLQVFTVNGRSIGLQMYESQKLGGLTTAPIKFHLDDSPQVTRLKALASSMIVMDPEDRPTIERVIEELDAILASMPEEPSSLQVTATERLTEDFPGLTTADKRTGEPQRKLDTARKPDAQEPAVPQDEFRPRAAARLKVPTQGQQRAPQSDSTHKDSRITIIGGYTTLDYARSCACWREIQRGSWEQMSSLPEKLFQMAVTAIKDGLFMAGGGDENDKPTNHCYVYFARSNQWHRRRDMPTVRGSAAAVTAGDRVIVMGGHGRGKVRSECESYDMVRDVWTTMNAMLQGMKNPIAALIQSQIFILLNDDPRNKAQCDGDEFSLQILNNVTGEWQFGPSLPAHFKHTHGAQAVSYNDTMLVAGGEGRILAQYIPSTSTWLKLTPPHLDHHYGGMVVSGGKVVIMGGLCKDKSGELYASDEIEEYDVERDVWVVRKEKMPCALWVHRMVKINY